MLQTWGADVRYVKADFDLGIVNQLCDDFISQFTSDKLVATKKNCFEIILKKCGRR